MSSFFVDMPQEKAEERYLPPPVAHDRVFATLMAHPAIDEGAKVLEYVSRYMGVKRHFVRSESDFEYEYRNEANGFRGVFRAWVVTVDTTDFRGRRIIDFIVRFLPSPWYEVERQAERDAEELKRISSMGVAPVQEEVKSTGDVGMTEEDIVRSYEKARRMAEINSSVPPSVNADLFSSPSVVSVDDVDAVSRAKEKKRAVDDERKRKEAELVESMLRNRKKILDSAAPSA